MSDEVGRIVIYSDDNMEVVTNGRDNDRECWRTYNLWCRPDGVVIFSQTRIAYEPPEDWSDAA